MLQDLRNVQNTVLDEHRLFGSAKLFQIIVLAFAEELLVHSHFKYFIEYNAGVMLVADKTKHLKLLLGIIIGKVFKGLTPMRKS